MKKVIIYFITFLVCYIWEMEQTEIETEIMSVTITRRAVTKHGIHVIRVAKPHKFFGRLTKMSVISRSPESSANLTKI